MMQKWQDDPAIPPSEEVCSGMTEHQKGLVEWHLDHGSESLEHLICQGWLSQEKGGIVVEWAWTEKRIKANPRSLPTVLAFACVHHAQQLGFCWNTECANRCFIASRNDQRYCSPECARPAKRAAKRRWWKTHRGKNAQAPKTTVKTKPMKGEGK